MNITLDKIMFNEILQTQSHSRQTRRMEKTISRIAQRFGGVVTEDNGNLYVVKGNAELYPCVVAHTDTVHSIVPHEQFVVRKQRITERESGADVDFSVYYGWNPVTTTFTGIGGDDKVGIFAALSMLQEFDNIKLAFFRDEEIGCIGSGLADMKFFEDVSLVLECDRQGNKDFIERIYTSSLYGRSFSAAVKPILDRHGYKETHGAMTDVQALKEQGLGVACANMSCGYWNPHSANEYIVIEDVRNCFNMVATIIDELGGQKWEHSAPRVHYYGGANSFNDWGYHYNSHQWTGKSKQQKQKEKEAARAASRKSDDSGREYRWMGCANCESESLVRKDQTEDKWYCTACLEYVEATDEEEDTFDFLDRMDREFWDD